MEYNKPLRYYTDSNAEPLTFHLINVGEGLMFLTIFPDETTFLFDCNITNENETFVLDYLGSNLPYQFDKESGSYIQQIDIFVNSHRDDDHLRGLSKINKRYPIRSIWDSGETGVSTGSSDYQYYMGLRRRLNEKYGDGAVIVPNPSKYALDYFGGAGVFCLNSSLDYTEDTGFVTHSHYEYLIKSMAVKAAKVQHTNSVVLSIKYANRSILLTGDSDWLVWRDKIVPNFEYTGLFLIFNN